MLNINDLHFLSTLVDLRELDEAKELAADILATAEESELQTITRCAEILDSHAPAAAKGYLEKFARELDDERHSALVQFCKDETGDRPHRPDADIDIPVSLSVYLDTRPGYHEHDAQPAGLDNPTPWEIQRAHRWAQLQRQLRDHKKQLPAHIRTALRDVDHRAIPDTPHPHDLYALNANPHTRKVYDAYRDRGMTHRRAFTLATTTEKQRKATTEAKQKADDYMRTRLGTVDHTAPPRTTPTLFDIDDHTATKTRYRAIRCGLCGHTRQPEDTTASGWDDGLCRECRHVMTTFRSTPCVWCWIQRADDDHRGTAYRFGHADGHDDGLCGECRDKRRRGIPQRPTVTRRIVRTVAYLNPQARAAATHAAAITARCAAIADYLPPAAALAWLRAYYGVAPNTHRPSIAQWVTEWQNTHRPQPPTPITPAAVPAAPAPELAAAA